MTAAVSSEFKTKMDNSSMITAQKGDSLNLLPEGFDIQGHRGARGLKPENTLPAFETALDLGVTTLELDLHLTAEGALVIWHDPVLNKDKCGLDPRAAIDVPNPDSLEVQKSELMISSLTFEQLQAFRCDRNPAPDSFASQNSEPTLLAGDDYRLVSLGRLFDFVHAYSRSERKSAKQRARASLVQFNIETKRVPEEPTMINDGFDGLNPGPFENAILELAEEYGLTERVIIQSFDLRSLWAIRSVQDYIRLSALIWSGNWSEPEDLATKGANIWSPEANLVTPSLIKRAHKAQLAVIPWTVNEPEEMRHLINMGVDGLITDRPDLLAGY